MSSKPKQDLPTEEETDEDFMTRITQPRIWTVFKSEFIFQVFIDERFDEVLDMFKVIYYTINIVRLLYYVIRKRGVKHIWKSFVIIA